MGIIYRPSGRAAEFSHLAVNHYVGCSHGCKYCWAPRATFNDKFHTEQKVKDFVIEKLLREVGKFSGTNERVLLSFATDPYQPLDVEEKLTREVLMILVGNRIPFQILTKGGMRAARDFDLYRSCDAFGTTLTFLDAKKSLLREPKAALPAARIKALKLAKEKGIETWVSLEPVIEEKETLEIIRQTHSVVDLYKIGILNYVESIINWRRFGKKAIQLCRDLKVNYFIKNDLAKHLDGFWFSNSDNRKVKKTAE